MLRRINAGLRSNKLPWLLAVCFVALGVMASLKTPLYQGFDEGWHYAYVEHYAQGRPLVNLNKHFLSGDPAAPFWQTHEAAQPPLYYLLMGRIAAMVPRGNVMQEQLLDNTVPNGMYGNFLPADDGSLGTGLALAGHLVRFATVLMGAIVVLCSYGIAHLLTGRWEVALLSAAVTAFNPRNIVLSAQISNDMAVACLAALTLLLATYLCVMPLGRVALSSADDSPSGNATTVRLIRDERLLMVLLGVGAGATLLMKYSGAAIAPAAALAVLCRSIRFRQPVRQLLMNGVLFGFGALLSSGWFLWHNWQLYGDLLAWNKVTQIMPAEATPRTWADVMSWVPYILQTQFGHPAYTMAVASTYIQFMLYLWLLSMVGLFVLIWLRRAKLRDDLLRTLPLGATLVVNVVAFVPWLRQHLGTENMRFFSPSFVPITLLFVLGVLVALPRRWWAGFAVAVTVVYGLFTAITLWQGFNLMYAFPNYIRGDERTQLIERPYAGRVMFENGIELLDAQIESHRLEANEPIALTLVWRSTQPITQSAHLMLDVRDEAEKTVASLNTGNAVRYSYVTRAWQVGEPVRERYLINVPITRSQVLRVLAGWNSHGAIQQPIRPINNPSVSIEVARVKVHAGPTSTNDTRAIAHIVGLADLLSARVERGEVVLMWRAAAQPDQNYTVFVHGLDGQGQIVAQNDVAFSYSAVYWNTNEIFEQRIPLPDYAKATTIKLGVYDPATMQRLPAQSADGAALEESSIVVAMAK